MLQVRPTRVTIERQRMRIVVPAARRGMVKGGGHWPSLAVDWTRPYFTSHSVHDCARINPFQPAGGCKSGVLLGVLLSHLSEKPLLEKATVVQCC
ncbi:hypothetical protein DP42_4738 [Burkholderia pseudomallei]|nr:hypothetical protein DP42_4738 [Burkholderia pseudomallei]